MVRRRSATANVRAVVSIEPGSGFVFPGGELPEPMPSSNGILEPVPVSAEEFEALTRVPIIVYYGDNIPTDPTDIAGRDNWRVRQRRWPACGWRPSTGTAGTQRSCRCPSGASAATPTSRSATSTTTRSPTRSRQFLAEKSLDGRRAGNEPPVSTAAESRRKTPHRKHQTQYAKRHDMTDTEAQATALLDRPDSLPAGRTAKSCSTS